MCRIHRCVNTKTECCVLFFVYLSNYHQLQTQQVTVVFLYKHISPALLLKADNILSGIYTTPSNAFCDILQYIPISTLCILHMYNSKVLCPYGSYIYVYIVCLLAIYISFEIEQLWVKLPHLDDECGLHISFMYCMTHTWTFYISSFWKHSQIFTCCKKCISCITFHHNYKSTELSFWCHYLPSQNILIDFGYATTARLSHNVTNSLTMDDNRMVFYLWWKNR